MLEGLESASRPHPALSCRHGGNEGASRVCFMSSSVCSLPFSPISFTNTGHFFAKQKASCDFPAKHSSSMVEDHKKKKKEVAKYFFI